MITVLLADDHKLVRKGIRKILEGAGDIDVIGEAASGEEALELVEALKPDICIMDKFMPGMGGFEASRRILARGSSKIICLTVYSDMPLPRKILELGAQAYLTKDCTPEEIIEAVRMVDRGERYLAPVIARRLADETLLRGDHESPMNSLSERELQVLLLITQGDSTQAISDKLCLSPKTVSTYRSRIFQKLDADNNVDLVRMAMRYGLLDPEPPPLSSVQ